MLSYLIYKYIFLNQKNVHSLKNILITHTTYFIIQYHEIKKSQKFSYVYMFEQNIYKTIQQTVQLSH